MNIEHIVFIHLPGAKFVDYFHVGAFLNSTAAVDTCKYSKPGLKLLGHIADRCVT